MSERDVFEYALLRVVPRVERGECFNAGVLVYCRAQVLRRRPDPPGRGQAAGPGPGGGRGGRAGRAARRRGRVRAAATAPGQAAGDDAGRRFRWLIAPRSTVVQPGPVHTGLTADPAAEVERLLDLLVR